MLPLGLTAAPVPIAGGALRSGRIWLVYRSEARISGRMHTFLAPMWYNPMQIIQLAHRRVRRFLSSGG